MSKKKSDLENRLSLDNLVKEEKPETEILSETNKPFVFLDPGSSFAEAFKILRTNLKFTMQLTEPRSLVVTSPMTAEGKTTITSNIASSFAQSGMKVAVVGADMRIPSLYREFGLENEIGLSNYLNNEIELSSIMIPYEEEPRLTIIPSGAIPPNSADLLSSERLLALMETLKEKFDLVIFDTPPVNLVADTLILGPMVDGVLVVINKGLSKKKDLKICVERLRFSNIVGFVMNASSEKSEHSYYKSKYGYGYGYSQYNSYSHYRSGYYTKSSK